MYYWIALNFVQGIGSIKYKALISHFRSPEIVLKADVKALCKVDGIGKKLAGAITSFDDYGSVEDELEKAERLNAKIISYFDYPLALKKIKDSPPLIYVRGDFSGADSNAFGIVGARKATIENMTFAEEIGRKLACRGVTVVSGMALGIDSAAHRGALSAGGRTIAVLGSGVDVIYPYSNKELYEEIIASGAVISEFGLSTPPNKENFPRRNRIISGLSKGVLVVEANMDSGSLITADYAIKQGRKLFAVPGNVKRAKAKGTNNLIKKGAILVDSEEDIFSNVDFIRLSEKESASNRVSVERLREDLNDDELKIYETLEGEAAHIDDIIKRSSVKTSLVSSLLLNLELKGYVKQFAGKMFLKVN